MFEMKSESVKPIGLRAGCRDRRSDGDLRSHVSLAAAATRKSRCNAGPLSYSERMDETEDVE